MLTLKFKSLSNLTNYIRPVSKSAGEEVQICVSPHMQASVGLEKYETSYICKFKCSNRLIKKAQRVDINLATYLSQCTPNIIMSIYDNSRLLIIQFVVSVLLCFCIKIFKTQCVCYTNKCILICTSHRSGAEQPHIGHPPHQPPPIFNTFHREHLSYKVHFNFLTLVEA